MFFYSTQQKFDFTRLGKRFSCKKLANNQHMFDQAAEWAEKDVGYLRGFPGIEVRKEILKGLQDNFYMVCYEGQPVGMFALLDCTPKNDPNNSKETKLPDNFPITKEMKLTYVYVDFSFRGLGIGGWIVEQAKKLAKEKGAHLIVLDTLKPSVDHFYQKHEANIVCEARALGFPTTKLSIGLK